MTRASATVMIHMLPAQMQQQLPGWEGATDQTSPMPVRQNTSLLTVKDISNPTNIVTLTTQPEQQ